MLTPGGFRTIGSLRIGDLVTGSDGRPTPVIGIYPQGRKQVFRVRAQDGASTLCCAEHLWHVFTPEDRRRAKEGRVLETQEMIGRLRRAHQHRYELPVLSAPAAFEPETVPLDPYALGLLLGDGCLTTRTTPSFTTSDPELAEALESALPGIELKRKGAYDYVLRHVDGHRGGVIVANPVTTTLRELGLAGTYSHTKFVPQCYLYNAADVRLALLQGLLDSDGGPVAQRGRTCRIQYTTCSARLRDDVVFVVRSLGGVAYWRRREAEGRPPGFASGRSVAYRHDSFVMDIRLPAGTEPFRLGRKLDLYQREGGGRPMRYIDAIEPAGEAETVCIQVAAADSLYVTEDFLVTHNTLNDSFIILDEAQNTSPEQMQMFLTRLGFGSKVVVTGDITQIDLPREQASGLIQVQDILGSIDGIEFVRFGHEDVVRHKLVQRIVEAYKLHSEETGTERKQVIEIEVDNRSGEAIDEAGARELAPTGARRGGNRGGRARARLRRAGREPGAEAGASRHRRGDRRARVSDRRARRPAGRDCRASSATSSSARRSSARSGGRRSCTRCCISSATTTATRWTRARRCTA